MEFRLDFSCSQCSSVGQHGEQLAPAVPIGSVCLLEMSSFWGSPALKLLARFLWVLTCIRKWKLQTPNKLLFQSFLEASLRSKCLLCRRPILRDQELALKKKRKSIFFILFALWLTGDTQVTCSRFSSYLRSRQTCTTVTESSNSRCWPLKNL